MTISCEPTFFVFSLWYQRFLKLPVCPLLLSRKVKFFFYSAEWDLNISFVNYCTVVKTIGQSFRRFLIRWIARAVIVALFLVWEERSIIMYSTFNFQIKSLSSFLCVVFFSWLVFIMRMKQLLPCQACNSSAYSACTLHRLKIYCFSQKVLF